MVDIRVIGRLIYWWWVGGMADGARIWAGIGGEWCIACNGLWVVCHV